MLKGIDSKLPAHLVYLMMQMGHGDEIAIVDANFPAHSTALETISGELVDLPGLDAPAIIAAMLQHFPLDEFSDFAAWRMEIDNTSNELGDVHREVFALLNNAKPEAAKLGSLPRQKFYQNAKNCFAVVRVGEMRPFGCFILRKGVIF
jgi:L-fucose mutarotase